jgi:hypothetical protein
MNTNWITREYITSWPQFDEIVRSKGHRLLNKLDEFPDSILVTGCQRSGTTMLSRIVTQSDGMVNYWFGPDDELDAALILSGYVQHEPDGRYCFQTTYINARYHEYYEHFNGHKILWVLRNPFSVVFSMLYNWRDAGINRLFKFCGISYLNGTDKWLYLFFGLSGVSRLRRACWAYKGKVSQVFDLVPRLGPAKIMVVDYDDLVSRKEIVLPAIYKFIDLDYRSEYSAKIHMKSLGRAKSFSRKEFAIIESLCKPTYLQARKLLAAA